MSAELVSAIDAAVGYVSDHAASPWSKSEVGEFSALAATVYKLAVREKLDRCLPQIPDLMPLVDVRDPPFPPPRFESKLNLPGDWDQLAPVTYGGAGREQVLPHYVFVPCIDERWYDDMKMLRDLAGGQPLTSIPQGLKTLWYHGEKSYSIDGVPVNVTPEYHNVLQAFLKSGRAMGTKELEKSASNPSRALTTLAGKFPGTVRKPEKKNDGYFIRVVAKANSVSTQ